MAHQYGGYNQGGYGQQNPYAQQDVPNPYAQPEPTGGYGGGGYGGGGYGMNTPFPSTLVDANLV
jgi:hypothetical protein